MISSLPTLVNGVAYTHADIIMNILGAPVTGVTSINYTDKQAITNNYATGHKPVSRGFGTITFEASITMTMEEVERLSKAAPFGRIQNIPDFTIGVNFGTEDGKFTRHKLLKCRFTGRGVDSSVSNSQIEEELELTVGDIEYV